MLDREIDQDLDSNHHSPQYWEAHRLIYGINNSDHDNSLDSLNLQPEKTVTYISNRNFKTPLEEEEINLKKQIQAINKKISKINEIISNNDTDSSLSFCCGILCCFLGMASIGAGIQDVNDGHVVLGTLEEINGLLLINTAVNEIDKANYDLSNGPSITQLIDARKQLKKQQNQLRIKLYEIEKKKTLQELDECINNQSPLYMAVINQFDAIDKDIQEGKFSKTYIDLSINTRKIIKAKTPGEREYYANQHVGITTKESISSVVCGSALLFVGVVITIASTVLTGLFVKGGPVIWSLGLMGVIFGVGVSAAGVGLIKSGVARERTPLLKQSLFNVANMAINEPLQIISPITRVVRHENKY